MKLAMELFHDEEVGQWGYSVPALSIVGTGCESREDAYRLGLEAVEFVIESQGQEFGEGAEVVLLDVDVKPEAQAG